ncbi:MAG: contractile injection system tape measure protein [Bacteroidota bacterium]
MQRSPSHIVKRQIVEISVADASAAQRIPDRISQWVRQELPRILDRELSARVPPDVLLCIDRLELELGSLSEVNLESQISQRVRSLLADQLAETVHRAREGRAPDSLSWGKVIPPASSSTHSTLARDWATALCFYWQNGVLPWWLPTEQRSVQQLVEKVLQETPSRIWTFMAQACGSRAVRRRLLATLPWRRLLDRMDENGGGVVPTAPSAPLAGPPAVSSPQSSAGPAIQDTWRRLRQILRTYWVATPWSTPQREAFETELAETLLEYQGTGQVQRTEKLLRVLATPAARMEKIKRWVAFQSAVKQALGLSDRAATSGRAAQKLRSSPAVPSLSPRPTEEGLVVDQVGLVLLWPYLQLFFRELGLVADGQFVDRAAREKGVHLLHYLARGDEPAEEPAWVVAKLLCGLAVEDFVPLQLDLTETEREECEHLLEVVIRNWKVLKKSSVASLRGGFILRSGLLTTEQSGWLLQVERTGLDILLDRLPWPLSVIKLPWNDYILNVKW